MHKGNVAQRETPQRNLVWEILEKSHDHPTAQAVYEQARRHMPSISLGTVYRNLQVLRSQKLLIENKIGRKPARYETWRHLHYHITCTVCGALEDVSVPYQHKLDRKVEKEMSYRLQEHRMEFYGICPQCQADESQ